MAGPREVDGCLTLLELTLLAASAPADDARVGTVVGSDLRISGTGAIGDDLMPAVAFGVDRYLVVWSDFRSAQAKIYGRFVENDGTFVGGDFRVSGAGSTANETAPAVAFNDTQGEFLVVWGDDRNSGTRGRDIYGRRIRQDGTLLGNDFRISGAGALGWEYSPAVAWSPVSHTFLVVWEDGRDWANRSWDVWGRIVTADGKVPFGEIQVSGSQALGADSLPDVAAARGGDANPGFLVVWEDERNFAAGQGYDIYGRRLSTTGGKLGPDFRINGHWGSNQQQAAVAYCAQQYLVVWRDGRNVGTTDFDIYGRRIGTDGTKLGGDFAVTSEAHEQGYPDVAFDTSGSRFLVVWQDWRNYGPGLPGDRGSDTFARRVAANGTLVGGNFLVSGTAAVSHENDPAVAYGPSGDRFMVVWSDWRNQGTRGDDIFGRRVAG